MGRGVPHFLLEIIMTATTKRIGHLAKTICNKELELQVCKSQRGFYIGTYSDEGPCSRESNEYYPAQAKADAALENGSWTQKVSP